MLTTASRGGAPVDTRTFRICTICDGLDAVLRLAGYVAQVKGNVSRTDLALAEALDFLKAHDGDDFEQIIIAPDADKEAAPRLVSAVLDAAAARSSTLVVLLPPKTRLQIAPRPGLRVLYGPPFEAYDAVSGATLPGAILPEPPRRNGGLRALFLGGKRASPTDHPTPPAKPLVADTPPDPRRVIAVQPLSGGSGATTLACNFAAEFAQSKPALSVCILDLNLQFGNVGTYFDLPADSRILDAYRNIGAVDSDAFQTCLHKVGENLHIFTSPGEILPVDGLTSVDLRRMIGLAQDTADLVILDLPHAIADWSEGAFSQSDLILGICALDVRSAQNAAKLKDLIRSESMPHSKLSFLLNRASRKRNRLWREALSEMETGLGAAFARIIPDGGDEVTLACNAGIPLWKHAPGNPARAAIRDFCDVLRPTIGARASKAMAG